MPDKVIVNTSPIFYLYKLQYLEILQKIYKDIIVPSAVLKELEEGKSQGEKVPNINNYKWIQVKEVEKPKFTKLIADLGQGETEVLILALEHPNSLVIIDDLLARNIAKINNIKFTGTIGILLKAKQLGYIKSISSILKKLTDEGFRLKDNLIQNALEIAGEK